MMKMPILLSGHSMTPVGPLRPQSMGLNMRTDGLSSATIVLDENNPDVSIGAWVQIWAPNGEMCVMYVKNRKKDYITGQVTLSLEHTFGLLQAMVVFGEVTAATMSGTQEATTCTVYQAITYLLNQQTETLWTMASADCDFNDAQGWKFTNSDIYNDLNSLTDAIMDCQWEFDQSVFPWKLKLKAWPVSSTMEMRRNRNLESLKVTQDRSGMYTRVYPTGKNNLHIDAANSGVSYLDRNTATYGVIAQVITDSTIASADLLKAWAQKQLKKNAEPKYTVSITGYDLSEATGEPMDHFIIGRMCRIPLPDITVPSLRRSFPCPPPFLPHFSNSIFRSLPENRWILLPSCSRSCSLTYSIHSVPLWDARQKPIFWMRTGSFRVSGELFWLIPSGRSSVPGSAHRRSLHS